MNLFPSLWDDISTHRDAFWNILLQLPPDSIMKAASTSEIGEKIIDDQSFWRQKFQIDNPELYEKIHKFLPENFNWKAVTVYDWRGDLENQIYLVIRRDQ